MCYDRNTTRTYVPFAVHGFALEVKFHVCSTGLDTSQSHQLNQGGFGGQMCLDRVQITECEYALSYLWFMSQVYLPPSEAGHDYPPSESLCLWRR